MRTLLLSVEDHVTFLEVRWLARAPHAAAWPCKGALRHLRPVLRLPLPQGRKVRHVQENRRWIDDYK